jgi:hypothetical protein
MKEHMKDLEEK